MKRRIMLLFYYAIFRYLPNTTVPIVGHFCRNLRAIACRHIFKKCGKHIDIARGVYFGNGRQIELSDNSGLGPNCRIVNTELSVGEYVMMGPDVLIQGGHKYDRLDIPMGHQGYLPKSTLSIGNDVWIGARVTICPNVGTIGNGVISVREQS